MSDLPSGWAELTIGDVTRQRKVKVDPSSIEAVPFIGLEEVEPGTGIITEIKTTAGLKSAVALFKKGDVLYGRLRPYLKKVVISPIDGAASAEFIVFKETSFLHQKYLQEVLKANEFAKFASLVGTGDRPRVSYESIAKFRLGVPPVAEQGRIVAKIDSLTAKSKRAGDHLKHIPRLVEKYKQAILNLAFKGALTPEFRLVNAVQKEHLHSMKLDLAVKLKSRPWKTSQVSGFKRHEIPGNWNWGAIGDIVVHRSGLAFDSADFVTRGTQVLRLGNLYQGKIDLSRQPVFLNNVENYRSFFAFNGDILVTQTGTRHKRDYGNFVVLSGMSEPVLVNQRILCLSVIEPINPWFVAYFSQTPSFRDFFFDGETGGVSQGNVGVRSIMDAPIPLPPIAEQEVITRRVKSAFDWIDRLASEATSARKLIDRLNQAILSRAFRGELVPQDPTDEPASALLDRIRADRDGTPRTKRGRRSA